MLSNDDIAESLRGHLARNAELLKSIKSKGVDVTKMYPVEHHFWAPDQSRAAALGAELYARGYLVTALSPTPTDARSTVWNVEAQIDRTLTQAGDAATTEELVQLAAPFDAIYDGWGAAI